MIALKTARCRSNDNVKATLELQPADIVCLLKLNSPNFNATVAVARVRHESLPGGEAAASGHKVFQMAESSLTYVLF